MIDATWVREKFLSTKKYWSKLNDIISKTSDDLESDLDLQLKAERIFEILIQIILDICTHIIANMKESPPQTYAECMKKLSNIGVISEQTGELAISLVKMRNIVVHQYGKINYNLLFEGLRELSEGFPIYQDEVLKWVESQDK